MSTPTIPRGPGSFEDPSDPPFVVEHANGHRYAFDNFRRLTDVHLEGKDRPPGSVLIGWASWLLALIGAGALYVSFSAQRSTCSAPATRTRPASSRRCCSTC